MEIKNGKKYSFLGIRFKIDLIVWKWKNKS